MGDTMKYILLDKQKEIAIKNYNYFFKKFVFKTLINIFEISLVLIINQFLDIIIFGLLCYIFIIVSIYSMFYNIKKYYSILSEIINTLNITDLYIFVDYRTNFIKKAFDYER